MYTATFKILDEAAIGTTQLNIAGRNGQDTADVSNIDEKAVPIQQLRSEYDAVLITIGASTDKKLGLEGEDADGVISAVQFLRVQDISMVTGL